MYKREYLDLSLNTFDNILVWSFWATLIHLEPASQIWFMMAQNVGGQRQFYSMKIPRMFWKLEDFFQLPKHDCFQSNRYLHDIALITSRW